MWTTNCSWHDKNHRETFYARICPCYYFSTAQVCLALHRIDIIYPPQNAADCSAALVSEQQSFYFSQKQLSFLCVKK